MADVMLSLKHLLNIVADNIDSSDPEGEGETREALYNAIELVDETLQKQGVLDVRSIRLGTVMAILSLGLSEEDCEEAVLSLSSKSDGSDDAAVKTQLAALIRAARMDRDC